jgi:hypothetical protein
MPSERPLCIYVDVDNTLVHSASGKTIPNSNLVARVRQWKAEGALLYCWSSHGAAHAQQTAEYLKIRDCFLGFLTKPHVLVDDQSIRCWPYFLELFPARAETVSSADMRDELDRQ